MLAGAYGDGGAVRGRSLPHRFGAALPAGVLRSTFASHRAPSLEVHRSPGNHRFGSSPGSEPVHSITAFPKIFRPTNTTLLPTIIPSPRLSQSYPKARETSNNHVSPRTFITYRRYRSTHSGRRAADRIRIPHPRRDQPRQRPALHRTPHSRRQSARVHERRQARTLLRRSAPPR